MQAQRECSRAVAPGKEITRGDEKLAGFQDPVVRQVKPDVGGGDNDCNVVEVADVASWATKRHQSAASITVLGSSSREDDSKDTPQSRSKSAKQLLSKVLSFPNRVNPEKKKTKSASKSNQGSLNQSLTLTEEQALRIDDNDNDLGRLLDVWEIRGDAEWLYHFITDQVHKLLLYYGLVGLESVMCMPFSFPKPLYLLVVDLSVELEKKTKVTCQCACQVWIHCHCLIAGLFRLSSQPPHVLVGADQLEDCPDSCYTPRPARGDSQGQAPLHRGHAAKHGTYNLWHKS